MNTIENLIEHFDQLQLAKPESGLGAIRKNAFNTFNVRGIPTSKQEDWKYTRIGGLFNKEYQLAVDSFTSSLITNDLEKFRLPGHEQANELVTKLTYIGLARAWLGLADLADKNNHTDIVYETPQKSSHAE